MSRARWHNKRTADIHSGLATGKSARSGRARPTAAFAGDQVRVTLIFGLKPRLWVGIPLSQSQ